MRRKPPPQVHFALSSKAKRWAQLQAHMLDIEVARGRYSRGARQPDLALIWAGDPDPAAGAKSDADPKAGNLGREAQGAPPGTTITRRKAST